LTASGTFAPEFLVWLRDGFRLSDIAVGVDPATAQFRIEVSGPWSQVTLWETMVLAIVNELYYREVEWRSGRQRTESYQEGRSRLERKLSVVRVHPDIRIVEFGTRRRFRKDWQRYVVGRCMTALSSPLQLLGTSNVLLAKESGLHPIGTFAHELDMVYSGIYRDRLRRSHYTMLRDWWRGYGETLSIALTDTYTSDFFFEDFTTEQARAWRGLRQDSGDPFAFADKAIAFYERHDVDPMMKTIIFSDGLDVEKIVRIADHCRGRVGYAFGWGTDLTNDVGFRPLSLVMKATRANGHGLVKLSDNLAKAQGSPEDIALFTRTFGHAPTTREECKY